MKRHVVIPDCQTKSGVDLSYLSHVGQYIVDMKPDAIICIGDFADMPSLSSYDKGKKSFEGRRYKADVSASRTAMDLLMQPIHDEHARLKRNKERAWKPELHLTLGNHEHRINRTIEAEPILDGTIGIDDLGYHEHGWQVHDFLKPVTIDGIAYAHYFISGAMGRPISSARALANKKHMSCVMGHLQTWELHRETRADGRPFLGLFCGACYLHDEDYLGPQGNNYWRGVWVLNEVDDGDFQPMPVSLAYLARKYH
jgi:hypothetical protein